MNNCENDDNPSTNQQEEARRPSLLMALPDLLLPAEASSNNNQRCCGGLHSNFPKDDPQTSMKAQILRIQRDQALTPKEKAVSMQQLMMRPWNQARAQSPQCTTISKSKAKSSEDARTTVTYQDKSKKILGCEHYQRKCKFFAECCGKWYTCRFCHDASEDHVYDRYSTKTISCMKCHTVQPVGKNCTACGVEFGHYFCGSCKFYDDDQTKDIYHCDKCNICRIGKGLGIDYFHCDKCNACMSITLRDHKCVERSLESNCPICHTYMFTSTTPVMFLPCGHCMHVKCYEEYTQTNYVCPICSKSLGDMRQYFNRIDELLARERMPEEYAQQRSEVFCSDCERKSTTKFHFLYHKCQYPDCGSYNTKVTRQFQVAAGEELESVDPSTPRAPPLTTFLEYE